MNDQSDDDARWQGIADMMHDFDNEPVRDYERRRFVTRVALSVVVAIVVALIVWAVTR